ncbi:MAG: DinB family protein [Phycisphaerales bacterium]|nr:DinB family protein [Phycisphaerales bacterium]
MHPVLSSLLGHNQWATRIILEDCAKLSQSQWDQEFEIGPGSLRKTMTHIVGAMQRWTDRISEARLRESLEDDGHRYDPLELADKLEVISEQLGLVAADVERSNGWERPISFATSEGQMYRFTRGAAMAHVLTHGMHHRAQALNMRRRLGLAPLGLDLDVVEWEAMKTGQL